MRRSLRTNLLRLAVVLCAVSLQLTACTGLVLCNWAAPRPRRTFPWPRWMSPWAPRAPARRRCWPVGAFGVCRVFSSTSKGSHRAVSGYAGGSASEASYDQVSTGTTGNAESVEITYDPSQITYGQLLRIFFSVVQDPTQLDRQGPDVGTQYRSAIFPQNDEQQRIAESYITQLNNAKVFGAPIVTRIENATQFVPAEATSSGFPELPPDLSLCRHQRHAQARQPHASIPGSVSRTTRPRRRGAAAEVAARDVAGMCDREQVNDAASQCYSDLSSSERAQPTRC